MVNTSYTVHGVKSGSSGTSSVIYPTMEAFEKHSKGKDGHEPERVLGGMKCACQKILEKSQDEGSKGAVDYNKSNYDAGGAIADSYGPGSSIINYGSRQAFNGKERAYSTANN